MSGYILRSRIHFLIVTALAGAMFEADTARAAVARTGPSVGEIVSARGDADIRLVQTRDWLTAEASQQLLAGDDLRTGRLGAMAIVFSDRTQIRVHRNAFLTVKAIAQSDGAEYSVLRLGRGSAWARAARGGTRVDIETPAATAAIRGTDWSLAVDENRRTTLIVLDGTVALSNAQGRVTVAQGEIAFAEVGKAPSKTALVRPRDREQILYNLSLRDALRTVRLTDLKTAERRRARAVLEALPAHRRTGRQWLDLAELAYDQGDRAAAQQALAAGLAADSRLSARADLVAGYLAAQTDDYARAAHHLAAAEPGLDPERRLTALVGRVAALLLLRRSREAEHLLAEVRTRYAGAPRLLELDLILTAFSGDLPQAARQAREASRRYPQNPRFPGFEALVALTLDRREVARAAAERALALDPESALAHLALGRYLEDYRRDSEAAIAVFRRGIAANGNDATLWGALGLSYQNINEYRLAEQALRHALALVPNDVTALSNYAVLLLDEDRVAEAREVLDKVDRIDPTRDFVLTRLGRLALQTDQLARAQEEFLKATTVNPALSEASLGLAITYYENGDLDSARQALENAGRLDPREPLVPLVSSIIARDRAEADAAIEYARQAIGLYRTRGGSGVTGLAASRGGSTSLGSAFANLDLNAWAGYYNELSFDPYSPDSHFSRAVQGDAALASLAQGLILEPLAGASRNRYIDLFRRPFNDAEIGLSLGWPGNGISDGQSANLQGFTATPSIPVSYYLSIDRSADPGDRNNADTRGVTGTAYVGMNLTPDDRLELDFNRSQLHNGYPGPLSRPDPDNRQDDDFESAGIGYAHYFAARDVLLARLGWQHLSSTYRNGAPFGTGLSSLDYSLATFFGQETAELLHRAGLTDVTDPATPDSPVLLIGGATPNVPDTLSPGLDRDPTARIEIDVHSLTLQARHMLTLGDVDFSYGAEAARIQRETRQQSLGPALRDPGLGTLVGPGGQLSFPFVDPVSRHSASRDDGLSANAHVDALWRVNRQWWLEGGLFVDRYDYLDTRFTRWQPRVGTAWQVDRRDWLRLAVRQDTGSPITATLAPVSTVGLIPGTRYVSQGGRTTDYLARWDREWTPHLFTALELGRQEIRGFSTGASGVLGSFDVPAARLDYASLSANLWLRGGIGLFARALVRENTNRSAGVDGSAGLPLVPGHEITAGLTWVHPSQLRLTLMAQHVGERPADTRGSGRLGSYTTANLGATWQPLHKRLQLGATLTNLTDRRYDYAAGYPAPGRYLMVSARWRF